jgi:hypothetical protein
MFDSDGGEIYLVYKARWEAAAKEKAKEEALASVTEINDLFSMPSCILNIGTDEEEEPTEDSPIKGCYEKLIALGT